MSEQEKRQALERIGAILDSEAITSDDVRECERLAEKHGLILQRRAERSPFPFVFESYDSQRRVETIEQLRGLLREFDRSYVLDSRTSKDLYDLARTPVFSPRKIDYSWDTWSQDEATPSDARLSLREWLTGAGIRESEIVDEKGWQSSTGSCGWE